MRKYCLFLLLSITFQISFAQTADEIVSKLKAKLVSVKDYEAVGKLKTDVAFLQVSRSFQNQKKWWYFSVTERGN